MYFYKFKGRQVLDLRGDFILTHNQSLVTTRVPSAAPSGVKNAQYIKGLPDLPFGRKLRASWAALRFIWGPNQALKRDDEGPA